MYCQKCGFEIANDAEFCPRCGTKVMSESIIENDNKDVNSNNKSEPKNNKRIVKIIIAAILTIAIISVLIKCVGSIFGSTIFSSYKIPADVEVVATTVNDYGYFVVKNTGDKIVKDFTLTVVGYDSMGNAVALYGKTPYKSFDIESANIMPNSAFGLGRELYININDVKYLNAIVSKITYKDGTVWQTEGLDAWAKDMENEFSIESYKQYIDGLKTKAILAESNPYLRILSSRKYYDDGYLDEEELDVSIKNIGNQTIKSFNMIVLQYDNNGFSINVQPWDYVMDNAKEAFADSINLASNEETSLNWSSFFNADCKTYKLLIYSIEFKDGTVWTNENALPWMLYNEDERK